MEILSLIGVLSASFFITIVSIFFLRPFAIKKGILDVPNGILKIHEKPTPYLGGVAIYCGVLPFIFYNALQSTANSFIFCGLTILLIVGFIDDLYVITPLQKILGQLLATFCFLKAHMCFTYSSFVLLFPFLSYFPLWIITTITTGASIFWMLIIINACNLIDIMDGLLATLTITIIFLWLMVIYFCNLNACMEIPLLIAFLGSVLAFFCYNKPKAALYSGDAGSLFLGGFLSLTPFLVYDWQKSDTVFYFILPFFIFFIPLVEVISLILIRTAKRIPFYYGSPHHFVCYLKRNGWSVKNILKYIFSLSLFFGFIGIFVAFFQNSKVVLHCSFIAICFFWINFIFNEKKYNFF